jgi:hypothetical protein
MKTKLGLASLVLLTFIASCKQESNDGVVEGKPVESKVETFDVVANVIVPKDDDLIIYYKDVTNEWFDEDHAVWQNVKGSSEEQEITFSLPEGVTPNNLRFDFSKNPEQGSVRILKLKISYLGKSFEVPEDKIKDYFEYNECVKYDAATKLYTPSKNTAGIYDPFLSINIPFYNEIEKLNKGI